jgi:hypothetical protein
MNIQQETENSIENVITKDEFDKSQSVEGVDHQMQELLKVLEPMTKKQRRTKFFRETTREVMKEMGAVSKGARKMVRDKIRRQLSNAGENGASEFASIPSRKERKALAKEQGVPFEPQYNGIVTRKIWD